MKGRMSPTSDGTVCNPFAEAGGRYMCPNLCRGAYLSASDRVTKSTGFQGVAQCFLFGAYAADKLLTSLGIEQLCGESGFCDCARLACMTRTAVTPRVRFLTAVWSFEVVAPPKMTGVCSPCFFHFGNDVAHLFEREGVMSPLKTL